MASGARTLMMTCLVILKANWNFDGDARELTLCLVILNFFWTVRVLVFYTKLQK